jgi:hypothetical protein
MCLCSLVIRNCLSLAKVRFRFSVPYRSFRKVVKSVYYLRHVRSSRLSVRLSACTIAPTAGRIDVKFASGDFYENLSRKSKLTEIEQKCQVLNIKS